jgi:CheY-like chemotaxis protein
MNKILVVDDAATIPKFIKAQLCKDYEIICAENGSAAL